MASKKDQISRKRLILCSTKAYRVVNQASEFACRLVGFGHLMEYLPFFK